jgi:ankyrin repeat protein
VLINAAAQRRNLAMIDLLLSSGADINARSRWWAGGFGVLDTCEPEFAPRLIERGAVVDAHASARLGMFAELEHWVMKNPDVVHARGGDGQTPLHFAKTVEIARFLLQHGADIDARDIDHESTPAQYMVRDRQDVARFLVAQGCTTDILMAAALGDLNLVRAHLERDPTAISTRVSETYFPKQNPRSGGTTYIWTLGVNKTAHMVAREFGHEEIFRFLMDRSPPELLLVQACELGDEATFNAMLAERPNLIESLSEDDLRKLPEAVVNNNLAAVRLMLAAGWPVTTRGDENGTPLHIAAWMGNADIVREILRYNPPVNVRGDRYDMTPLGWAFHGSLNCWRKDKGDYPATVELLLNAGAEVPEAISDVRTTDEVRKLLMRARREPK